ncbi:ATP-sensitive inward rectifier potassium channel 12 [Holothuria leucospilota]|uniref:ATP-sensitive inward rectifier potassium channel 12 n=1 Tax=Holothuria leucospilota TaxID=206669 RepID=A0A9Q1H9A9_HOLLE|nr:ATP-sensitive inward rectifier potassium channel 12 [Holothuria leucospilota]
MKWRWVLLIFSFAYVIGWIVFAGFWYALAWDHGDIGYKQRDKEWEPCVANVENFKGAFLFSVETQTTIGYGFRSVTEACWMGGFLVVLQSVFSCLVDVVMTGCIFVKLARPKKRAATITFSENATIAKRGGKRCLMFRVGNVRQSHMYDVKIRAHLVESRINTGKTCEQLETHKLILEDNMFLIWPMVIVHEIDENSPLYKLSELMLREKTFDKFEIIVFLEGILEQTGLMMQARTSYLPSEILWGHAFTEFATPDEGHKRLTIDYRKFNSTYKVESTTDLSAKERSTSAQQIDDNYTFPPETYSDLRKSNSFENSSSTQEWNEHTFQEQESGYVTSVDEI